MKPFLMNDKGGIYIINLQKTVQQLDKAADFLGGLASKNKQILFVGCKRQAQDAIREAAEATGQHYVNHRWLGGMLTNATTVRKSVERLRYLENIEKQPEFKSMSKKEPSALGREREKLLRNLRGVRNLENKPDAIVMHPGPINRGVEIDSAVVDGKQSVILPQVTYGIAVRMAVMSIVAGNEA